MSEHVANLPEPDAESAAHSSQVQAYIQEKIAKHGPISFAQFMDYALYAPGLGYYSVGTQKFGEEGDFVTAPEISTLFSKCLAQFCAKVLREQPGEIIEFGAGTGVMAADILLALDKIGVLPERYAIMEVSADLRARQQKTLKDKASHLFERVDWLDQMPSTPIQGVVLANEVLDAMPVHKFRVKDGNVEEFYVDFQNEHWRWVTRSADSQLRDAIEKLDILVVDEYVSEINLAIPSWIRLLSDLISVGKAVIIDYGFLRHEYYHPERNMGTLKCHYRHHSHDNPLQYIGIQDITAHVDFSAVGDAATDAGFRVESFSNQAQFLIQNGLLEIAETAHTMELSQQIKTLTLPGEMGEIFKVMVLGK